MIYIYIYIYIYIHARAQVVEPFNAEQPELNLSNVTPNPMDLFYKRSHGPILIVFFLVNGPILIVDDIERLPFLHYFKPSKCQISNKISLISIT